MEGGGGIYVDLFVCVFLLETGSLVWIWEKQGMHHLATEYMSSIQVSQIYEGYSSVANNLYELYSSVEDKFTGSILMSQTNKFGQYLNT